MGLDLNTLSRFLNHFGSRKVHSSPHGTNLSSNFTRRDSSTAARSARIRAAKSAGRTHGTSAREAKPRAARHRRPLQRCNTVIVPQPETYPHPPGAFILETSFVVPGFPEVDDCHIPPHVAGKLFLDELFARRRTVLRAAEEREAVAEAAREAEEEFARLVEQDLRRAREAQRRAEEAEYVRQLEEDRRRVRELFRQAVEEERRRVEQEQEEMERARRERERNSQAERFRAYEKRWTDLRSKVVSKVPLRFGDIPWPVFETVRATEDITQERIGAFVFHPSHKPEVQGHRERQVKIIHLELLRWHEDKFDGLVLNKVAENNREAVKAIAGQVARVLTRFKAELR